MSQQLSLTFDDSLAEKFSSLRAVVALGIHERGHDRVASLIDMAPSNLSSCLAGETRCLSIDKLEAYVQKTGDTRPIEYLIARYIGASPEQVEAARQARIESLLTEVASMLKDAPSRKAKR